MQRTVFLLAVAVLAVLAIMVVMQGRGFEPPPVVPETVASDLLPAPAPEAADKSTTERREVAKRPISSAPPPTTASLTVVVRDADTLHPVPNAQVAVVRTSVLWQALDEARTTIHTPTGRRLRSALAHRDTTDTRGEVALMVTDYPLMIEARHDSDWGFAMPNSTPEDGRATVTIGPDRDLCVQVVDERGLPRAAVPVALRRQTSTQPRKQFSYQATTTEPPDGIATFLHLQRRLHQGTGWHATFAFPVRGQPAVPVDASTPATPPQRLQLPPTGGLRIALRDPDGNVAATTGIEIRVTAHANGTPLWSDGPWAHPRLDQDEGVAMMPWLGLGLELVVEARRSAQTVASAEITGPTNPGQIVECELRLAAQLDPVEARGRFVMNDGNPWPACTVSALARLQPTPNVAPHALKVVVDAAGRFALTIEVERPANGSRRYLLRATHPDGTGTVSTLLPLDQDIPPEGIDLGDVCLDHGPLLLAGTVLGPGRQPVAGARVHLLAHTLVRGDELWPNVFISGIGQTGKDGRFRVFLPRGEPDPGSRLRLRTSCDDYVTSGPNDVVRGDENTIVLLQRAGSIAGSFALANGLEPDDLLVVLRSETVSGSQEPPRIHVVSVKSDGLFERSQLAADAYTLTVRRSSADNLPEKEPVVVVENLQVLPGDTCHDPRILNLPIAALCSTLHITVVNRHSTPLTNATVEIVDRPSARPRTANQDGVCRVLTETVPVDLEVTAFGYRPRRLTRVISDRSVVLDDGIAVRLRAGTQPNGRDPEYRLGVYIYDVDDEGKARRMTYGQSYPWQSRYFDTQGQLALRLPAPGVYECSVFVSSGKDRVGRSARVNLQPMPRIAVLEGIENQVFDLNIPQREVDDAAVRVSQ